MTTSSSPALTDDNFPAVPRGRTIVYWVATVFVAGNAAVAGMMDIFRIQPVFGILLHLGYPAYFGTILGIWKVLGALALLAPGCPRLKEWAYAGMFFDFTAAAASYMAIGDGVVSNLVGPIMSIVFLVVSWALHQCGARRALRATQL
jgi:hypothetical protein